MIPVPQPVNFGGGYGNYGGNLGLIGIMGFENLGSNLAGYFGKNIDTGTNNYSGGTSQGYNSYGGKEASAKGGKEGSGKGGGGGKDVNYSYTTVQVGRHRRSNFNNIQ